MGKPKEPTDITTIQVTCEVRDAIQNDGKAGETYDTILRRRFGLKELK